MRLVAVVILQAFVAGAQRDHPVRPHLDAVVQRLQRLIVEGIFRRLVAARPDQRLMRIGQTLALEIRHRVGLAPDHIVQNPEALVLQLRPQPEDVVIAADHPDRAIGLKQPLGRRQPVAGEGVIGGKAGELVPVVVHSVHDRVVGAQQFALQLQVIGRIGEDQIDGTRRQCIHHRHAIARQNLIARKRKRLRHLGFYCHAALQIGSRVCHVVAPKDGPQVIRRQILY